MNKKQNMLETIRHIPIKELLGWHENELEDLEKQALREIKTLKKGLYKQTLSLKWIQGILRIKKAGAKSPNGKKPQKSIIMVLNLPKED